MLLFTYHGAATKPRLLCCVCVIGLNCRRPHFLPFGSLGGALDSAFLCADGWVLPSPSLLHSSANQAHLKFRRIKSERAILTPACCRLDQNKDNFRNVLFKYTKESLICSAQAGGARTLLGYLCGCMCVCEASASHKAASSSSSFGGNARTAASKGHFLRYSRRNVQNSD